MKRTPSQQPTTNAALFDSAGGETQWQVSPYQSHPWLGRLVFQQLVQDFLIFGNLYVEKQCNRLGGVIKLDPAAKFLRRGIELDSYWWVPNAQQASPLGEVFHLLEPDINQEVYGLPEYLAALNSA